MTPRMERFVRHALGPAALFGVALLVAWAFVAWLHFTWDRALLVQVLWTCTLNRWYQDDK